MILATPDDVQGLVLALDLRLTPGECWGTTWEDGVELGLAMCKESAYPLDNLLFKSIEFRASAQVPVIGHMISRVRSCHFLCFVS